MTRPRRKSAAFSSTNLGFVGCASGLASVVFPPLVLVSLSTAHCAWWRWRSGREERGFGWAMAAMLIAHFVFGIWAVLFGFAFADVPGVTLGVIYTLMFFASVACVLNSKASKYFVVGSGLVCFSLALIACGVYQQILAARDTHCVWNLRALGVGAYPMDDGYDRHPDSLAAQPSTEEGYSWLVKVLPYLEEESVSEEVTNQTDPSTYLFLDETPYE